MPLVDPLYGPPKVGADVLSYCGKCKMDLAHVVVSMTDGRPAKVICKTCKSEHKYRGGTGVKSPSTRSPRKTTPRTTIRISELWEQKLSEKSAQDKKSYLVTGTFVAGDVIDHPQFGLGIVGNIMSTKMTVLFRDSERVLVHGLKGS